MKTISTLLLIMLLSSVGLGSHVLASTFTASTPTLLWSFGTGGAILDVKPIPDVNGDGKPDVAVGSADNNMYVLDGISGLKVWSKLTGADVVSVDYIKDITGDGFPEIVSGSSDGKVYLLNGANGKEIWARGIDRDPPIYRVLSMEDVTGDGVPDVVAGGITVAYEKWDVIECKSGVNGSKHWALTPIGDNPYIFCSDITKLMDVTGDGKQDIVWNGYYYGESMYLIDGASGAVVKGVGVPRHYWGTMLTTVPDVSGDGYEDVANTRTLPGSTSGALAIVFSGPTLEEIWRFEKSAVASDERMWDANYISDINSDGRPEIVIGWKDKVFLLSGVNGKEIWNTTVTNGNSQYTRSHRITEGADISGDGIDDIVVGVQNGKVYFLSGQDGTSIFDTYQIGGSVNSVAYLDDVTGDAFPEILIGGGDHFVYSLTGVVKRIGTKIAFSLNPNPAIIGASITLIGNLTTVTNFPIPSAKLTLKSNSTAVATLTTNSTGWFKVSGQARSVGTFNVSIEYAGSTLYLPSSDWEILVVNKAQTWLYAIFIPNPVNAGESCELRGILVDQFSNTITFARVVLEYSTDYGLSWNPAGTLTTDAYGVFSKTFKAPSPGTYLVRISFTGSPSYEPSEDVEPLIVR